MSGKEGSFPMPDPDPYGLDVYATEVQANLDELKGFVSDIRIVQRPGEKDHTLKTVYEVRLLEGTEIKVEFVCGRGYFVLGTNEHFETFQALLSTHSPQYRKLFAEQVSKRLMERSMKGNNV